jgi:hypothetical protein
MDSYLRIVTYKTAFYTFYLPVAAGLVLAGEARPAAFDLAKSICVTMGQYFQVGVMLHCYIITKLMCGTILQERPGLLPLTWPSPSA